MVANVVSFIVDVELIVVDFVLGNGVVIVFDSENASFPAFLVTPM